MEIEFIRCEAKRWNIAVKFTWSHVLFDVSCSYVDTLVKFRFLRTSLFKQAILIVGCSFVCMLSTKHWIFDPYNFTQADMPWAGWQLCCYVRRLNSLVHGNWQIALQKIWSLRMVAQLLKVWRVAQVTLWSLLTPEWSSLWRLWENLYYCFWHDGLSQLIFQMFLVQVD
jgi:hypothetical protein